MGGRFTALASIFVAALAGCGSVPNAAAAVDYRRDVRVIAIEEFEDSSPVREESNIVYNKATDEGRQAAARARDLDRRAQFTYAVAHNVARRLKEAEDALRARGLAVPKVLVLTTNHPGGIVATGAGAFSSAFEDAPRDLPPPSVRVRGAIRYDVERSLFTEYFRHTDYGKLYPYDRFEAASEFTIDEGQESQRYFVAFLSKPELKNLGLPGLDPDPRGQLVARVADHLAPTRLKIDSSAPLAFVRRVLDDGKLEVDIGLERRTLKVAKVLDLEQPLPEPPSRDDLARVLGHQYVRVRWRGGPEAPSRTIFRRIEVEEPPPS